MQTVAMACFLTHWFANPKRNEKMLTAAELPGILEIKTYGTKKG